VTQHTVHIPKVVQDQITRQVLFIADDSIDNALAWEARLAAAIDHLDDAIGFAIDEDAADRLGFEVRRFVFEHHNLIHYRVDSERLAVHIVSFRHAARLPGRGEP
jgi:plasmid stabilization system protein ParE